MQEYTELANGMIRRERDGVMFSACVDSLEYQEFLEWIAAGNTLLPYRADPAEILSSYEAAIEARLDQFAQGRGYRHGDRLASYKGSANATWAAEADRFIELREPTWTKFISITADIKSGKRPMPTLDELLLELPVLSWDANV